MIPSQSLIKFDSGGVLVRDAADLPSLPPRVERLYADFETTSGAPDRDSKNPWYHCSAIGASVTWDSHPVTYFVPRALLVTGWWRDLVGRAGRWVNHNVKYDMHVSQNDLGVAPPADVTCTMTGAKLIDSDRAWRGGYGLDVMSKQELGRDIGEFEHRMAPYLHKNKDYGRIPLDLLAEYACVDTEQARDLDRWVSRRMPEESQEVWRTEQRVTRLLFKMEQTGLYVDPHQVQVKQLWALTRMVQLDAELSALVGYSFRPHVSEDCYDVLCGQYGLPVMEYTAEDIDEDTGERSGGGPSFNKAALKKYLVHPDAPVEVVKRIMQYRELNTFNSLFLDPYLQLNVNGVLHGTYNQCVRTGRMSCSKPNLMQLSKLAKELILPPPGHVIVSADYSQIEFRIIVHYTGNRKCIEAYRADPWTDFHQLVSDEAGTNRDPAKTINFMMGYGGGKKKTIAVLSINKDIVGDVIARVEASGVRPEARQAMIAESCKQRALSLYDWYHRDLLPELKPTSRKASAAAYRNGYVRNWYGRRRVLPENKAHIAFNTVCQSTAGDMIKERMVALDEETPELAQAAQVHDNVFGYLPEDMVSEANDRELRKICSVMNDVSRPLEVPVRTAVGWSRKSWRDCAAREMKFRD